MSVFDPEGVATNEYMPDQYLTEMPEYGALCINADEFSIAHAISNDSERGHVNLT